MLSARLDTKYMVCTCIFLVGTAGNHVVSLSDETFQSLYGYTFWKPCWAQAATERNGSVLPWAYVPVCVCNKTGSYILILTYKELNPIHAAQTPKSLYTSTYNKLQGGRHLESVCVRVILSPRLRKVVSTVMVLHCDWSSSITAGKSMGFFEKPSLCRCVCVCVSVLVLGTHINLISLFSKSTSSPEPAQTKSVKPLHVWLSYELTHTHARKHTPQPSIPHQLSIRKLNTWIVTS